MDQAPHYPGSPLNLGGGGKEFYSYLDFLSDYNFFRKETMSAFLESILHEIKSCFKNPLVQHNAGFVIVLT